MKSFILSSVIMVNFLTVAGQATILDQYIRKGLENNVVLRQENLNVASSIEALREAKGMFLPEISFSASYMRAHGGRNIDIPVGDLVNPIYQNLNELSDQNRFPTDLENEKIQLLPNNFHDTRLELRLPLFNSDIYHNHRAKRSLISMNESRKQTYEKELIKEIKVAYYQYLRAYAVRNTYQNTRKLLEELLRVNQSLVKNHKATIDVVYRAEFELSDIDSKIAQAEKQVNLAAGYFNFLLNQDLSSRILIDSTLQMPENVEHSLSIYQEQAINSRNDLNQFNYALETQGHMLNLQKGKKLPNISLGAQAGYQGFGYDFGNNQDYALLSLNLEFPLFNGFQNNSRIQQTRIQVQKLELELENLEKQIRLQVLEAYRNLEAARASFNAQQAAAKSAAKNFEIVRRKYQENLVLLVEFLDARTKYTNSQTSMTIAKYMVLIRRAELERAVSL